MAVLFVYQPFLTAVFLDVTQCSQRDIPRNGCEAKETNGEKFVEKKLNFQKGRLES